jgi:hypothetical protein
MKFQENECLNVRKRTCLNRSSTLPLRLKHALCCGSMSMIQQSVTTKQELPVVDGASVVKVRA